MQVIACSVCLLWTEVVYGSEYNICVYIIHSISCCVKSRTVLNVVIIICRIFVCVMYCHALAGREIILCVSSIDVCIDAIVLNIMNIEYRWTPRSSGDVKEIVFNCICL